MPWHHDTALSGANICCTQFISQGSCSCQGSEPQDYNVQDTPVYRICHHKRGVRIVGINLRRDLVAFTVMDRQTSVSQLCCTCRFQEARLQHLSMRCGIHMWVWTVAGGEHRDFAGVNGTGCCTGSLQMVVAFIYANSVARVICVPH